MKFKMQYWKFHIQIWLRERKWAFMRWFVAHVYRLGEHLQRWAQSQPYWTTPAPNRYAQTENRYRRTE